MCPVALFAGLLSGRPAPLHGDLTFHVWPPGSACRSILLQTHHTTIIADSNLLNEPGGEDVDVHVGSWWSEPSREGGARRGGAGGVRPGGPAAGVQTLARAGELVALSERALDDGTGRGPALGLPQRKRWFGAGLGPKRGR